MSSAGRPSPALVARALRVLLPGPVGEEARGDLEEEYEVRRSRRGAGAAGLWYASHLVRPSTWRLAVALWRQRRARGDEAPLPAPRGPAVSWLDVKLGLRMLAKHPVMTLVSGLAMSVTIAVAIGAYSAFRDFLLRPELPLPEGERIVSLGLLTTDTRRTERRLLHEFEVWRTELETVEQLSIWRTEVRNIVTEDGRGELTPFAMMSSSGFEVARVPPLRGRPLLASDELPGAAPVLVIGYEEWMTRFGGDPAIVGRQIVLDRTPHTIVGVMPEGFGFPVSHRFWLPFTDDPDDYELMGTPAYFVFGRLAPSATLEEAQAELSVLSTRRGAEHPETHARLVARVMPYTDVHTGMDALEPADVRLVRVSLGLLTLLVLIPFANVAILVYARTVTRASEISVRSALGASRARIVSQLFVETFVLAALSAVAGVGLALLVLRWVVRFMDVFLNAGMPFWARSGQDPSVILYGVGITVLAAVVAGVVPGLQATGRGLQANLKQAAAGSGARLGRMWTALVVTQVAVTVALLPVAGSVAWQAIGIGMSRPTFAADEYLSAQIRGELTMASASAAGGEAEARQRSLQELLRQLEADARVRGATLATRVPGDPFTADLRLDVEGIDPPADAVAHAVGTMGVLEDLPDVLGVRVESGRWLAPADWESDVPPVAVSRSFVERVLGGANPIGRRIREYRAPGVEPAPWREIVGVIGDLGANLVDPENGASMVFTPLDLSALEREGLRVIAHVPESAAAFVPEFQRIANRVDPSLPVAFVLPLGELADPGRRFMRALAAVVTIALFSILLLCAAGVFALMSFNVTQRRREIGIRSALGASAQRVLGGVMARSLLQLAIGVAAGLALALAVPDFSLDGMPIERDPRLLAAVTVIMVVVGLSAAAGPTRRGLRIQPTEALKEG